MSVSTDITSCAAALGALAGQVSEEQWALLRAVRQNLTAHAEQVQHMETALIIPEPITTMPQTCAAHGA